MNPHDRSRPRGWQPLPRDGRLQPKCMECLRTTAEVVFCKAGHTHRGVTYYYCPRGHLPGQKVQRHPCPDERQEH